MNMLGYYTYLPPPTPVWQTSTRAAKKAARKLEKLKKKAGEVWQPYATPSLLRSSGLGIVPSPWEINRTLPGGPPFEHPFDPQYIESGERGWYYDTKFGGLGEIPTDAEYGVKAGYTPVKSGWIWTGSSYVPGPYRPGHYMTTAPQYGPQTSLDGAQLGRIGDAAEDLTRHQRRMFILSVVSTTAIALATTVALVKVLKD